MSLVNGGYAKPSYIKTYKMFNTLRDAERALEWLRKTKGTYTPDGGFIEPEGLYADHIWSELERLSLKADRERLRDYDYSMLHYY